MPKHSQKQRESSKTSAFELLDKGFSQKEVATALNISLRTLRRWTKKENYQSPSTRTNNSLVEISGNTKVDIEQIEQADIEQIEQVETIGELQEYHESQRTLAIQMGELTKLLAPKVKAAIELSSPADIPIRLIPSLTRAITDLADTSSECWSRATGLEEVLNVIQQTISIRQTEAGEGSANSSSTKQED